MRWIKSKATSVQGGLVRRCPRRRRAAVALELILALPVMLIFLAAVVEFGLILGNIQQVALASRLGAKLVAETSNLVAADQEALNSIAVAVRAAVDRQLDSAGMGAGASQGVTVRHTVGAGGMGQDGDCSDPMSPPMPARAVRVTVCVPLSKLTPNLLEIFGFSTAGKTVEMTTTYPYVGIPGFGS